MDQKLNKKVFDKGYISGHLIQAITGKNMISFNWQLSEILKQCLGTLLIIYNFPGIPKKLK